MSLPEYDGTSRSADVRSMRRNPRLLAWKCSRCEAEYDAATDLTQGCPRCESAGHASNPLGRYCDEDGQQPTPDSTSTGLYRWGAWLPYLGGLTLGEGNTPCVSAQWLATDLGLAHLWLKMESANPTGSHKDRMSALAVTRALERGANSVVLASSGNAGVSAACYAAAAQLACDVAVYQNLSPQVATLIEATGAKLHCFGNNEHRWSFVRARAAEGAHPLTNFALPAVGSPPHGVEAYRTVAFELAAQCQPLPEHILVPTARGDLLAGLASGFATLVTTGATRSMPRLWAVEPYPRLSAVTAGADYRGSFPGTTTQASVAGHTSTWQAVRALQATGGGACVVTDAQAQRARLALARKGWLVELCAAASLAGLESLIADARVARQSSVVLLVTASADRDPTIFDACRP